MKANTRIFGEIEIEDSKIIKFQNGIIGFPEFKNFALIFDAEKKENKSIMWLQCMDDGAFALPVMEPLSIKEDYNPVIEDEYLAPLGNVTEENAYVLVTVTVPKDITKLTVNLKAPIIINTDTNLASQLIVDDDYAVRFPIYDLIKKEGE